MMKKPLWLRRVSLLLVGSSGVLLLVGAAALAQQASATSEREHFYLESILPALERLESVVPQQLDTGEIFVPSRDAYDLNLSGDLLSLRRSFRRSVVEDPKAGPLGMALTEKLTTEASLTLGQTAFRFSSSANETKTLFGQLLEAKRVDVLGLQHSFGTGKDAPLLGFTRTMTTQGALTGETSTTLDVLEFSSPLGKAAQLALKSSQLSTDAPQGLQETSFESMLKFRMGGAEVPWAYSHSHKYNTTTDIVAEKLDLALPWKTRAGVLLAEHHSAFTWTNGTEVGQRTTHLALPFRVGDQTWNFDYLIFDQNKGQGLVETTTTKLVSPFRVGKSVLGLEAQQTVVEQGTTEVATQQAVVRVPLLGGQGSVQHQTTKTEASGTATAVEQMALSLAGLRLGKTVSFSGQHVSTETLGTETSRDVTQLSLAVNPVKPLQVEAQYQIDDQGTATLVTQQFHTRWTLGDKTSFEGRYSEADVAGAKTPNVLRLIEFVRESKVPGGLGFRAGLASYEAPGAKIEDARRVELTAGKPEIIALSAAYSEYDPKSFGRLPNEPTQSFVLQHTGRDGFALRCRYEDQPSRVKPLEAIELAMKALGGSLQLSYALNPLAPDGKTVRPATQYEAVLSRKLGSDLDLEVGYRYLDWTNKDDIDENIRLRLAGGREDGWGKLAFSYITGDFAAAGKKPNISWTPEAVLDVTYSRRIGDRSRISFSVTRQTAATPTLGDDVTEGRLEISTNF